MRVISKEEIKKMQKAYDKSKTQLVLRRALNRNSLANIANNMETCQKSTMKFSIDIKTLKATAQKSTGRCWIFAGCNVLREIVAKKLQLENFEFSQNYIAFWDKFEKANYYLETIMELIDCDYDDRVFAHLTSRPIQDGGQWDMFVNIVQKYGLMPKDAMPETFQSSNTATMNQIISNRLRKFTARAQKLHKAGQKEELMREKDKTLKEIYFLLNSCFGRIPESFKFEYVDKDQNYHCEEKLTPYSFYEKYVGLDLDDYISIINAPTEDKPFNKTYTIQHLGNVVGGKPIHYLNLEMEEFKEAVLKQLKTQEPVWFGSDCGKAGDRSNGIWDDEAFSYEEVLEMDLEMCKACSLNYRESAMNHAMVITGVNLVRGKPNRWKIENSWGEEAGSKGYFVMTDSWFDKYVYQAVINKKYLTEAQQKAAEQKPIVLKPWDPMGTLAI